ncbi:hypothetical protein L1987_23730 [Smallanthus sonchifolius]|uniref:Uncharacterized protein n=1 Tax=Smallanthus sonchifolius TaxID=185202 RepID=A0ACB9IJY3_9ASTR|nr:hypothetical protein L1987_23730 [Smallanthus sonchifolius]
MERTSITSNTSITEGDRGSLDASSGSTNTTFEPVFIISTVTPPTIALVGPVSVSDSLPLSHVTSSSSSIPFSMVTFNSTAPLSQPSFTTPLVGNSFTSIPYFASLPVSSLPLMSMVSPEIWHTEQHHMLFMYEQLPCKARLVGLCTKLTFSDMTHTTPYNPNPSGTGHAAGPSTGPDECRR